MRAPFALTRGARGALLFSVVILAIFAYAAYEMNTSFTSRARLFGNVIVAPALALALAQVVRELRRAAPTAIPVEAVFSTASMAWSAAFLVVLWLVGLAVTVPLFSFVYLRAAAREAWPRAALYGLATWLFIEVLFVRLLHVPLPAGVIALPAIMN